MYQIFNLNNVISEYWQLEETLETKEQVFEYFDNFILSTKPNGFLKKNGSLFSQEQFEKVLSGEVIIISDVIFENSFKIICY